MWTSRSPTHSPSDAAYIPGPVQPSTQPAPTARIPSPSSASLPRWASDSSLHCACLMMVSILENQAECVQGNPDNDLSDACVTPHSEQTPEVSDVEIDDVGRELCGSRICVQHHRALREADIPVQENAEDASVILPAPRAGPRP